MCTLRANRNTSDWPWVKGQHCVRAAVCAPVAAQPERPAPRAAARRFQPAAACRRAHREPVPRLHAATCAPAHQPCPSPRLSPRECKCMPCPTAGCMLGRGSPKGNPSGSSNCCRFTRLLFFMGPGTQAPGGCNDGRPPQGTFRCCSRTWACSRRRRSPTSSSSSTPSRASQRVMPFTV